MTLNYGLLYEYVTYKTPVIGISLSRWCFGSQLRAIAGTLIYSFYRELVTKANFYYYIVVYILSDFYDDALSILPCFVFFYELD